MERVMYFIAEDGTPFEDEFQCEQYEEKLHIKEVFEPFSCYDREGCPLDTNSENFEPDDVYYILVKEENYEDGSYIDLDNLIFEGELPALSNTFRNVNATVIYYNRNSETWEDWYERFNELSEMMKMFQLFVGKGE